MADFPSVPKDKIEDNIVDQMPDVPNTVTKHGLLLIDRLNWMIIYLFNIFCISGAKV